MTIFDETRYYYCSDSVYVKVSRVDVGGSVFWFCLNNDISDMYYAYKSNLAFVGLDYTPKRVVNEVLNFNDFKIVHNVGIVNVLSCVVQADYPSVYEGEPIMVTCGDEDIEAIAKAILISTGYLTPMNQDLKTVIEYRNEGILKFSATICNPFVDLCYIEGYNEKRYIYLEEEFLDIATIRDGICNFLYDSDRIIRFSWDS